MKATKRRFVLELDDRQLGYLLTDIEGGFYIDGDRGRVKVLEQILDRKLQGISSGGRQDGSEVTTITLLPIYCQLVAAWRDNAGERVELGAFSSAITKRELNVRLQAARAALTELANDGGVR